MESFWETLRDGIVLLLKVFLILFVIDAVLYVMEYPFAVPWVRDVVLKVFHAFGYTKY